MRWFDSITNSVDVSLSELQEAAKDGEAWCAAVHRSQGVGQDLATEQHLDGVLAAHDSQLRASLDSQLRASHDSQLRASPGAVVDQDFPALSNAITCSHTLSPAPYKWHRSHSLQPRRVGVSGER